MLDMVLDLRDMGNSNGSKMIIEVALGRKKRKSTLLDPSMTPHQATEKISEEIRERL
jgi:hypothetical protein